jgi:hypothetical protein
MIWPGFKAVATELGVQASLSIPLFAGSGEPVDALNLYARDGDALAPLSSSLLTLFDFYNNDQPSVINEADIIRLHDDAGSTEFLAGIAEAFAIQHRIHIAIGVLMQRENLTAEHAYVALREQAGATGNTLLETATEVAAKLSLDE